MKKEPIKQEIQPEYIESDAVLHTLEDALNSIWRGDEPGKLNDNWNTVFEIVAALQNQKTDAVEFKDWCDSGKAWFFDNQEEHTHTTEELYKLFKSISK